jgi:hypothetical protein
LRRERVMEKVRKGAKKTPAQRVSLARQAWVNIILFLLAGLMIGSGVYFSFQPEWMKSDDIKLYNQGVSAYNLPAELLPATEERPEEFPILRAASYFQQAASESTDDSLKALALYNLGTLIGKDTLSSLSGGTPWFGVEDGINRLEQAVRTDPNNEDAKYNLELLKKLQAVLQTYVGSLEGFGTYDYEVSETERGGHSGYSSGVVHKGY